MRSNPHRQSPNESFPWLRLERRILRGLACEYENASWLLEEKLRRALRPPLFVIREMKSRWGYWSQPRREIGISRRLVLEHPWDAVREVLRHEAAHQLADEVLGSVGQPPHGPAFRQACGLLRAKSEASGDFPLLQERVACAPRDPRDRVMRRIRKLLALAESGNRHEAEAAMVKAHELIDRYNIEAVWRRRRRDFETVFLGRPALRHTRDRYHLASLIIDYYHVQGVWVSAFVVEKGKMGRVLEISGTTRNLRIADYVYDFAARYIATQWNQYRQRRDLSHHRRTDFAIGIIEGFRSKLEGGRKHALADREQALVRTPDPHLTAYVDYRYPRTGVIRRTGGHSDEKVLKAGLAAGRRMVISRGIESTQGNRGRRIAAD